MFKNGAVGIEYEVVKELRKEAKRKQEQKGGTR